MISEIRKIPRFDEKVSKIIREYEKMEKREGKLVNFKLKRESLEKK